MISHFAICLGHCVLLLYGAHTVFVMYMWKYNFADQF